MGNNVSVPYTSVVHGGVQDGMEVAISGQPRLNCDRFSINLCSGPTVEQGDVAFHFNPRFQQGSIVRNHRQANSWGAEETAGGMPLRRGSNFLISIKVDEHGYKVLVNSRHFCDFTHRLAKQTVQYLHIRGDVNITSISLKGGSASADTSYNSLIPGGVGDGVEMYITGQPKQQCDRFSINLCLGQTGDQGDVAFHFNPRFSQGCVVRNHRQANNWGVEEKAGPMPFVRGRSFNLTLQVNQYNYTVLVDNCHFCDFAHRLPKESVQYLHIKGDVITNAVNFGRRNIRYPVKKVPAGAQSGPMYNHPFAGAQSGPMYNHPFAGAQSGPMHNPFAGALNGPIYNPPVPMTVPIQGGFHPGKIIYISGIPKVGGSRFHVNLVCGSYDSSDLALHFDVRSNYGTDRNVVVRNHRQGGSWGTEEKNVPYFPFVQGANFEMMVLCEHHCIKVAVNNQHFIEFRHRLTPIQRADHVQVNGDVTLSLIRFQ